VVHLTGLDAPRAARRVFTRGTPPGEGSRDRFEGGLAVTTSIPPQSGGGNAKYAIVGIVLLLIAGIAIWRLTQSPAATNSTPTPPPVPLADASAPTPPIGPTVGTEIVLNDEPDAGPDVPEPQDARVRIRYVTHYVGGNCSGQVDNEGVVSAARANIGGMRECYTRALRVNPSLRGTVNARWIINPNGGVGEIASSISDPTFKSCFEGALRRVRFPTPRGGCATANFNFPLTAN
jgi:hypothetical protein